MLLYTRKPSATVGSNAMAFRITCDESAFAGWTSTRRTPEGKPSGAKSTGPSWLPHPPSASSRAQAATALRFLEGLCARALRSIGLPIVRLGRLGPGHALLAIEPEPDVQRQRAGHVDRRVGAEDDSDQHGEGEIVDHLAAKEIERQGRQEDRDRGHD